MHGQFTPSGSGQGGGHFGSSREDFGRGGCFGGNNGDFGRGRGCFVGGRGDFGCEGLFGGRGGDFDCGGNGSKKLIPKYEDLLHLRESWTPEKQVP